MLSIHQGPDAVALCALLPRLALTQPRKLDLTKLILQMQKLKLREASDLSEATQQHRVEGTSSHVLFHHLSLR